MKVKSVWCPYQHVAALRCSCRPGIDDEHRCLDGVTCRWARAFVDPSFAMHSSEDAEQARIVRSSNDILSRAYSPDKRSAVKPCQGRRQS